MEGENGLCYSSRDGDHSFEGLEADTYFSNCPMDRFAIMCLKLLTSQCQSVFKIHSGKWLDFALKIQN